MKIAVVTFECDPGKCRRLSFPNKRKYCQQHGYTFVSGRKRLLTDRPASWSKLAYVLRAMPAHDWVFWSDADSLIIATDRRLEELIDPSYDFIVSMDAKGLNMGQFLAKSCSWTKHLLQSLIDYPHKQRQRTPHRVLHQKHWEQRALKLMIATEPWRSQFEEHAAVYPYHDPRNFNTWPRHATKDTFLVHYPGKQRDYWGQDLKELKMNDEKLEHVKRRWMREIYDRPEDVDRDSSYVWEGLLLGFLLGAGVPLNQSLEIARGAPGNGWEL